MVHPVLLHTYLALVENLPYVSVVVLARGVDVVPDGPGKEGRVLRDHSQVGPQGVQAHFPKRGFESFVWYKYVIKWKNS